MSHKKHLFIKRYLITWLHVLIFTSGFHCRENEIEIITPLSDLEVDSSFGLRNTFWLKDGKTIMGIGPTRINYGDGFYTVDSGGGFVKLIMSDSLVKTYAVLSPDGRKVAYIAAILGRHLCCAHVWIMNTDGTNARDVTPFGGNWENIQWSPDSRTILFQGAVQDSGEIHDQIVKVDIASGKAELFTRGRFSNQDPSYAYDGRKVAWSSGKISTDYGGKVFIANADGSDPTPIDLSEAMSIAPRFSPINNTLLFYLGVNLSRDQGLYSINVDSIMLPTTLSLYTYEGNLRYSRGFNWSPDGKNIIFLGLKHTNILYIADHHGKNPREVGDGLKVYLSGNPWSPDSRQLVFPARRDNDSVHVFIYDVKSNTYRKLNIFK